jgi:hypothetical protein
MVRPRPTPLSWRSISPRSNGWKIRSQADFAAVGEIHRVAQQVDEDLPYAFLVATHHQRQLADDLQTETQALVMGGGREQALQVADEIHEGDFGRLQA